MTRKDLEQLRALKFEIESLKSKLLQPKPTMQTIFYKDYRHSAKGIPKSDSGYDNGEAEYDRLERQLCKKVRERLVKISEVEDWIESIEDAEMRTIIRYYYSDGMSQEDIGDKIGYSRKTISRRLKYFWISCP